MVNRSNRVVQVDFFIISDGSVAPCNTVSYIDIWHWGLVLDCVLNELTIKLWDAWLAVIRNALARVISRLGTSIQFPLVTVIQL